MSNQDKTDRSRSTDPALLAVGQTATAESIAVEVVQQRPPCWGGGSLRVELTFQLTPRLSSVDFEIDR